MPGRNNGAYKDNDVRSVLNSGEAVGSVPFSNELITFLNKNCPYVSKGTFIIADKKGNRT